MNLFHYGFSKCGTSSIYQFFSEFTPTADKCLISHTGSIEFNLLADKLSDHDMLRLNQGNCYLKYSAGAFSASNVKKLHQISSFYDPVYLLSIRRPQDVLISWFNMHKRIAKSGIPANHFAVRNKDKYLNIQIDDYSREWVSRVDYSRLIKQFVPIVYPFSVYIVDCRNVHFGVNALLGRLLEDLFPYKEFSNELPKRNVSPKNATKVSLPPDILSKCDSFESDIDNILSDPSILGQNVRLAGR